MSSEARPGLRVGVLGGTFDPLHLGHLRAAEVAREELDLDRVLFVPAASPPHKDASGVTDAEHRLRMVEAALRDEPAFQPSRIEVDREGPSYTVETLGRLREQEPSASLYFIVGTDAFVEIRTWRRWEELLASYSFVVHERPLHEIDSLRAVLPEPLRERVVAGEDASGQEGIFLVRRPMLDVSSTSIRNCARERRSIRFLVPDAVEAYIRRHRLYR